MPFLFVVPRRHFFQGGSFSHGSKGHTIKELHVGGFEHVVGELYELSPLPLYPGVTHWEHVNVIIGEKAMSS